MNKRKNLVQRHNPTLSTISTDSPLSVGNGEFCFTADITGLQTLNGHYTANNFPLCTMSNWGWHTAPTAEGKTYEWEDLQLTPYPHAGRTVHYPVNPQPGNEDIYHWLRHNPHKFNLGQISLCRTNGKEITPEEITNPKQELNLYTGILQSRFTLDGEEVNVLTICDSKTDTIAFKVESTHKGLGIKLQFPYGHHGTSSSDWGSPHKHTTTWDGFTAHRQMDDAEYFVDVYTKAPGCKIQKTLHGCEISGENNIHCTFHFSQKKKTAPYFESVEANARESWAAFWNTVRLADFSKTADSRAMVLEQRMVRSLYLFKIQSMGSLPSAETGLTVNSWYGRFHSEMYLWHSAFLPLWNLGEKLLPSLEWHYSIIPQASALAASNGYKGLRWPKQTANTGRDAPSPIAPLLVWQQPHIIYMLELLYQNTFKNYDFLQQHWDMVKQLAEFMVSFLHLDKETGKYEMLGPLIPAQEVFNPMDVKSPIFEMEYFRFGLGLACEWGRRLGHDTTCWHNVMENIADPVIKDGLYLFHAHCPESYAKYNKDHPMVTGTYGLIKSPKIQPEIMKATLEKIQNCWQQETMWGWDYAMMAMCAVHLGDSELAVDLLLANSPKNQYVESGNNYQRTRTDLPLYLPGNGSLLLALPMLFANPPNGWRIEDLPIIAISVKTQKYLPYN
ncbi:MAG: glycoside hydrolase family 65 [Defluviitaleaceae bacterium]|nr:glycoside hydrolase family 65 [Defluviitaleaceae bacterium]